MAYDPWDYACIDAFEPVPDDEAWSICPKCNVKPRIWVFDNGRYANCLCCKMYGPHAATAESIMSVYRRTGSCAEHDSDGLRKAWNKVAESRMPVDHLSAGHMSERDE